jgi:hypothetical protein
MTDDISTPARSFRRVMQHVKRTRPKVEAWIKERISKIDPDFQDEVRQMAASMTWKELHELGKRMKAQAEQLELRAWFVDHTADELLLAQVNAAEKGEAA